MIGQDRASEIKVMAQVRSNGLGEKWQCKIPAKPDS